MQSDWDRLPVKKAWSHKDGQLLHATCGIFLHLMDQLKSHLPETDFLESENRLNTQFRSGFLDAEIQHLLESAVPPVQLSTVQFLRTAVCF